MEEFGTVILNADLKNYNTYRLTATAKYLVKPFDVTSLINLVKYLKDNNIKYLILGKGSNVILSGEIYDGAIILLDNLNSIEINKNIVKVEAGTLLNKLISDLVNIGLKGLENLYGIPGTVGGAILQNAGCLGNTISDYLIEVTYLKNNKIYKIEKKDCDFSYRNSIFKKDRDKVIISCTFSLNNGNSTEMKELIKENLIKRKNNQPLEYPNAGSVFKNPKEGIYAGKLISDANLKGTNINDAYVSLKHGNFIINKGHATSKDIIDLIEKIKTIIKEKYNIDLELEQEIIKF